MISSVDLPGRKARENLPYRSRERVYDVDDKGVRYLKHPVGARINEEEARRQGIIEDKAEKPKRKRKKKAKKKSE